MMRMRDRRAEQDTARAIPSLIDRAGQSRSRTPGNPFAMVTEPVLAIDPLADLLFGVAAILVLAVVVILPTVRPDGTLRDRATRRLVENVELRLGEQRVEPLVAAADGLRLPARADQKAVIVPLDRILDDPELSERLERMRASGEPLVLLIEGDGLETAFQFEAVAASHGPARVRQIRLDADCQFARSPAAGRLCDARAGSR
jgi:hypothetical protein